MTTSPGSNRTRLTNLILGSMGIAPALVLAACGGKVVVDSDTNSGAGGGGGSTASLTPTTSTGSQPPPACDLSGQIETVCLQIPVGGCPQQESPQLFQEISSLLNLNGCCPEDPDCFCSCQTQAVGSPCGPDPLVQGACCYEVQIQVTQGVCEGRPFTVDGSARTAELASRGDWLAQTRVDVAALEGTARRAIADAWARDALQEHASIASFARFALELLSVGAPADLVRDVQRAMGDEIRHAEIAFSLATAFAGAPTGPAALPIERSLDERRDLPSIAAAVVREGCIGETLAALVALSARDGATDPAVRAALDEISADECNHASLAWRFVSWALDHGGHDVRRAIEDAFAGAAAPSAVAEDAEPAVDARLLRAYGRVPEPEQRAIFARGLADVVLPCARALLSSRPFSRGCAATI